MIRANEKKEEVTTFIEVWAGHFGTSDDRQNGTREICFDESTIDVADQITMCLEGISVIPEVFMDNCLSRREQNGLCMITQMITQAANKTIGFLVGEVQRVTEYSNALQAENDNLQGKQQKGPFSSEVAELLAKTGHGDLLEAVERLNVEHLKAEVASH